MDRDGELAFDGLGTAAWVTDVGHVRQRNEDRLLVKSLWGGSYALMLVADGAGGHDSGDKAAEMVVATFNERFSEDGEAPDDGDPGKWIRDTIIDAHGRVKGLGHGQSRPPASTVVGLIVEKASLCGWRFHVGDSRLYSRAEDGMVAQWTRDHNITNGLIDRGLPVTQALKIADGGRLTQVLGGGSDPEPEILGPLKLLPGQVFLICSDGIYGHNADREVLLPAMNPAEGTTTERARELKGAVLDGEAPDNLSAVLWQVPGDAVATFERETVTNSMKAVTAADIARHLAESEEDAEAPTQRMTAPEDSGGGGFMILLLLAGALAAFLWWQSEQDGEADVADDAATETPAPTPAEPETPEEDAPLPWPDDPEASDRLAALVGGFDGAWWDALPPTTKAAKVQLLADLVAADLGPSVVLSYIEEPDGPTVDAEFAGWKLANDEGRQRAAQGWDARAAIISSHPVLGAQPGIPALMADAACQQVRLGWPRPGGEAPPALERWLAACLPAELGRRKVEIRLGAWPERGWSMDDLNRVRALALSEEGPAQLRDVAAAENVRVAELGLLAAAMTSPLLAHVEIDLHVVQSRQDVPAESTAEEAEALVHGRAVEIATLLRAAAGGPVPVRGAGWVADDLAVAADVSVLGDADRARIADLNRRVEVVVGSAVGPEPEEAPDAEEEELPGEVESVEEAELPDEPTSAPVEAGDSAPAGDDDDSAQ